MSSYKLVVGPPLETHSVPGFQTVVVSLCQLVIISEFFKVLYPNIVNS